jgi:hypothetical protein
MDGKYCYSDERAGRGYYALLSHSGTIEPERFRAKASRFFDGVKPRAAR